MKASKLLLLSELWKRSFVCSETGVAKSGQSYQPYQGVKQEETKQHFISLDIKCN